MPNITTELQLNTTIPAGNANCNLHHEETSQIQKCRFCPVIFETPTEYLSHIESVHQHKSNNSFMCSMCGKQYKTKNELTHHINSRCGTIRQFKCKVCGQELMSAGSLYNHMLRHNGERFFMCRFCAKLFFTAGQLKVHERIHTKDKAYICEVCNKGFCHRQSLITHSTLHTGIKPYQCENCGNSFSCVGNLIKHRKTHADTCGLMPLTTHTVKHPSTKIKVKINTPSNSRLKTREKDIEIQEIEKEVENIKTELLNKTDAYESDMNRKYTSEEIKDEKSFEHFHFKEKRKYLKTEIGDKESALNSGYPPHEVKYEEGLGEKGYQQFYTEDNSSAKEEYSDDDTKAHQTEESTQTHETGNKKQKHLKKRNDTNSEDYLKEFMEITNFDKEGYGDCKYCGKRYMNLRWFYKHMKEHENNIPNTAEHKSGVPLHKCSCCKISFYTKEENIIHQQTNHADILTCQDCEKIFANRDSLRSHQKVFHKGLGRKAYTYICDKCGKQFKQKSYLTAHEERNCNKGPFYECSICNKTFSSIYTRNNHMRIHNPEKKLLCKFCAKSFHWKGQLKIHERSHTGEKPFACLYCPKAFAYRESLITHSSIHTGIKPHLCEGCGSRFSCIGNLIKHKSSHASECGPWAYKTQKQFQNDTS